MSRCCDQDQDQSKCFKKLEAVASYADKEWVNDLCVSNSASIKNLCVTNLQVANPADLCNLYRATATSLANISYTLGSPINWNKILDDPNNNITLSPAFSYKVPKSGYYNITFHLEIENLQGANVISGTPVGRLQLLVNGNELRSEYSPFLSFLPDQANTLDVIAILNAGDLLTMKYDVLVLDQTLGLIPYVGSVQIDANGSLPASSSFSVILMTTLCNNSQPIVCPPCPPVVISCGSSSCLPAPVLNAINAGVRGSYVVSWSSVSGANYYTLEVANNSMFNNPSIAFQGNALSFSVSGQPAGTYYYRVFASSSSMNSPFSNIQSVSV